jgi:hypothetical protein
MPSFPVSSELPRRARPLHALCGLFSALLFWSQPVYAADESAAEAAQLDTSKTFTEAVRLYKAGDVARALPLFTQLVDATHSPNAELYVGYSLRELGRLPAAHQAFTAAAQHALALGESRYEATREAAEAQLLSLNLRLAKLTLSFVDTPVELTVAVDDSHVELAELGSPIVLEPGLHHVRASAPGAEPIARDVRIEAGGSKTLTLAFAKTRTEAVVSPATVRAHPTSPLKIAGLVTGGVGGAGVVLFAVAGLQAKGIHDRLRSECANGCSDPGHLDDVSRGKSLQTLANVSLGVGATLVASGAALFYLGYRSERTSDLAIDVLPNGLGVRCQGKF